MARTGFAMWQEWALARGQKRYRFGVVVVIFGEQSKVISRERRRAFYLDQAARCHSVGAHSAAVTMFRSALEWLLEDQGFAERNARAETGSPIQGHRQRYRSRMGFGIGPRVPPGHQGVRKYGYAHQCGEIVDAGHNAGDLTKQDQLDATLYRKVETTFTELLDVIYEKPRRRQERLADLRRSL